MESSSRAALKREILIYLTILAIAAMGFVGIFGHSLWGEEITTGQAQVERQENP